MPGGNGSRFAPTQSNSHRILLVSTALSLSLAIFAFALQWRGGGLVDSARLGDLAGDISRLPGVQLDSISSPMGERVVTSADCAGNQVPRSGLFPHHPGWQYAVHNGASVKIAITSSTSAGLEQILPWLYYHRVIGVTNFFLFVEGKAASPNSTSVLEAIPGVKVIHRTKDLEEKQAKSRIWNETWLSGFFYRPCNYELFVKQSLNMEMAIVFARELGMDWIIHLDTDELLHPAGAREYSLQRLLRDVAGDVDMVVFPNYESAIERDDIEEPFSEVTMFKKNYDHVTKETYFGLYREATRGNPNYFLTYGNGKAAARIQDNLRPNGAHRWHNYMKTPNEIKFEEAAVLHYTYTKFSDLTSRRDRCHCKPTKEDVKRCFMLDFDRAAFIIASTASQEEMKRWYREHVVWTDTELNLKLMRKGLLTRIYVPQVIVQGLREAGVFSSALLAGQSRPQHSLSQEALSSSISPPRSPTQTTLGETLGALETSQEVESQVVEKILPVKNGTPGAAIAPQSPPGLERLALDSLRSSVDGQ